MTCRTISTDVAAVTVGRWQHVVLTLDAAVSRFYADGALLPSDHQYDRLLARRMVSNAWYWTLGAWTNQVWGGSGFSGNLDNFGLWHATLAASEVMELFNLERWQGPMRLASMKLFFQFNYTSAWLTGSAGTESFTTPSSTKVTSNSDEGSSLSLLAVL